MFSRLFIAFVMVLAACSSCVSAAQDDRPEPTDLEQRIGRLLEKVLPTLDKTVAMVDRHDSLPDKSINPFDTDKRSNQSAIDNLLDQAIAALEVSEVTECRDRIRDTQHQMRVSNKRIAEYRRKRIAASSESELSRFQKVNPLVKSREDLDEMITSEKSSNAERKKELVSLKSDFANELRNIGLSIDDAGVDSLLGSISGDEFVSMLTVFRNIKQITLQLQTLTDQCGESMDVAKRYYGMYVVLVQTMDRLQTTFVEEIESAHIPKLQEFSEQAEKNIDEAQELIRSGGGNAQVLRDNIDSNRTTQKAAEIYVQYLRDSARLVTAENKQTRMSLATAQNTYKTVRLSGEVATLMRTGRRNFDALMQLQLPTIRDFGNETIKKEFRRMTLELRANR